MVRCCRLSATNGGALAVGVTLAVCFRFSISSACSLGTPSETASSLAESVLLEVPLELPRPPSELCSDSQALATRPATRTSLAPATRTDSGRGGRLSFSVSLCSGKSLPGVRRCKLGMVCRLVGRAQCKGGRSGCRSTRSGGPLSVPPDRWDTRGPCPEAPRT